MYKLIKQKKLLRMSNCSQYPTNNFFKNTRELDIVLSQQNKINKMERSL